MSKWILVFTCSNMHMYYKTKIRDLLILKICFQVWKVRLSQQNKQNYMTFDLPLKILMVELVASYLTWLEEIPYSPCVRHEDMCHTPVVCPSSSHTQHSAEDQWPKGRKTHDKTSQSSK